MGGIKYFLISGLLVVFLYGTFQSNPDGKALFTKHCLVCHQADGSGVPGMFPPLTGTDKVLGPADTLISILIFGINRPLEVKGVTYSQPMPALPYLKDTEIVAIINYIRTSWDNKAPAINVKDVVRVRSAGKK